MNDSERLLRDLKRASRRTGLAMSTLGKWAVKNGRIHLRLQSGGYVRRETATRLRAFLDKEMERRDGEKFVAFVVKRK